MAVLLFGNEENIHRKFDSMGVAAPRFYTRLLWSRLSRRYNSILHVALYVIIKAAVSAC